MDDMDRQILALVAEGFSDRQIAREVGLSRSGVRKRRAKLAAVEDDARDYIDEDEDDDTLARLELMEAEEQPEPADVVEPVRYAGAEDDGSRRYRDANGKSFNALGWYRFICWLKHEQGDPDDFTRAYAVQADMDRQVAEYEARRARRHLEPSKHLPAS